MSSITASPAAATKRISGFEVDPEALGFMHDKNPLLSGKGNSGDGISPSMLSAPLIPNEAVKLSETNHAFEDPYQGSQHRHQQLQLQPYASFGITRSTSHPVHLPSGGIEQQLPGSVPFSAPYDAPPQPNSVRGGGRPKGHGHSLSTPGFSSSIGHDWSAQTQSSMLSGGQSPAGLLEDDSAYYPNYSLESFSPVTPSTGKAPSSRSRSNRRGSTASPGVYADDMSAAVPRNSEVFRGSGLKQQLSTRNVMQHPGTESSSTRSPAKTSMMQDSPTQQHGADWPPSASAAASTGMFGVDPPTQEPWMYPGSAPDVFSSDGKRPASPFMAERPRRSTISRDQQQEEGGSAESLAKPPGSADKRKKRRESHNLVERRRRDGINAAIDRLSELLPEMLLERSGTGQTTHHLAKMHVRAGGTATEEASEVDGSNREGTPNGPFGSALMTSSLRPNKAVILSKTVEYVQHLQEIVQAQARRNQELEMSLEHSASCSPNMDDKAPAYNATLGDFGMHPSPNIAYDEELFNLTSNMELA